MDLIFRTFQENDQSCMRKIFNFAFCKSRRCDPMTPERWEWRYSPKRPNYAPEGYQICEYKGKIVGMVMATIRTMKFNGVKYRVAGIDDVSTCPVLERRGIARRLLENAVKFMETQDIDLSILVTGTRGHPRRLYDRMGFTQITHFSMGLKILSVRNCIAGFPVVTPLAIPLRLYGAFKMRWGQRKVPDDIRFEVLGKDQDEFRQKLNDTNRALYSFDDYSQNYWEWYFNSRAEEYKAEVVAAKKKNKIVAGGVISRNHLMIFNTKKLTPIYVLNEFFVDKAFRNQGLGRHTLNHVEHVARQKGGCFIMLFFHGRDRRFHGFLKKMGYLTLNNISLQMIKPISERAKEHFKSIEGKKFIWKVPYEQDGF